MNNEKSMTLRNLQKYYIQYHSMHLHGCQWSTNGFNSFVSCVSASDRNKLKFNIASVSPEPASVTILLIIRFHSHR